MTVIQDAAPVPPTSDAPSSELPGGYRPPLWRRYRQHSTFLIDLAMIWVIILIIISITAQWLPIHGYLAPAGTPNQGPNWSSEFFGTDASGRSMLSRIIFGARISIVISVVATAIAFALGSIIGLSAAYFGRPITTIADIIANSILSIPSLLLLLAIVLALRPSVLVIMLASSLVFIPAYSRLMRAAAESQMSNEYIIAAGGLGAPASRIIFRELLPNTAPALISYSALVLPAVMILEGSLSFLGFGVQSPTPSWGNMIALGSQNLTNDPSQALIPCAFLFVTVYALNTLGDHLRVRLSARA